MPVVNLSMDFIVSPPQITDGVHGSERRGKGIEVTLA